MSAVAYFSAGTAEADAKFAGAARRAGATLARTPYPKPGPQGEALFVSLARLGAAAPEARKALLVLSATHGVEGYAGAGLQTGLLAHPPRLPPDTALILVHAINPWGMAWSRREDHENVDLFRNFHYHDRPSTADPLYDEIDDALDLARYPRRTPEERARVLAKLVAKHGSEARLIAAIRRGQHHRPRGMTWHGNGPCWATRWLRQTLPRELAGCRQLAVLDVHTGFGGYGEGTVMSYDPPGDPRHERVKDWMGGKVYVPGADADIPSHAVSPYGFIAGFVPGLSVTAAILEYGTFDPAETREVFPLNHHYHVFGDPLSPEARAVAARYRRFCYPEEPEWMERVWRRGDEVVRALLRGLARWDGA